MDNSKHAKDPDVDPDLVHIGFVFEDRIYRLNMTPPLARRMGRSLFDDADLVEGKTPLRDRLRRRWKPGGPRDFQNFMTGMSVGVLFVAITEGIAFRDTSSTVSTVLIATSVIVFQAWRHVQDRRDFDEEAREKYHGAEVDSTTGQLPWEILR